MLKMRYALALFLLAGCNTQGREVFSEMVNVFGLPLTTDIYVTTTVDELNSDGDCSLREAMRSQQINAAVDACTPGLAAPNVDVVHLAAGTTYLMSLTGAGENSNQTGDLDSDGAPLVVIGDGGPSNPSAIDANSIDRAFHIVGGNTAYLVEFSNLIIREGCSNGGSCNTIVGGSIPTGGGIYDNSLSDFRLHNVRFTENVAQYGGGFAICAGATVDAVVEDVVCDHNTALIGGGCVDAHVDWTGINLSITENTVTGTGVGGGVRQYDKHASLENSTISNNVSAVGAGGGIAAAGNWNASAAGSISMIGGTLSANKANAGGGNAYVTGSGPQGTGGVFSAPCNPSIGCYIELDSVTVPAGRADDPTTGLSGSGGNLEASAIGGTARIDLRGSTSVSGGVDLSSPYAHDCIGNVQLYSPASVADPVGCTITTHGPVCGNSVVEAGEDCDSTTCCVACTFAAADTECDDADVCTPDDVCDAEGACVGGGNTCGDNTLQTSCGEECDDGNTTALDGCSAICTTETCTVWE
jgi:CSLREA domain-containing protein